MHRNQTKTESVTQNGTGRKAKRKGGKGKRMKDYINCKKGRKREQDNEARSNTETKIRTENVDRDADREKGQKELV